MPTVYYRQTKQTSLQKFHRTPDCPNLTKAPARGTAHPLVEIDLNDLPHPNPCLRCYPDVPRVKVIRRYCEICDHGFNWPCRHNGGVPVELTYDRSDGLGTITRRAWVWPEKAHHYKILPASCITDTTV